MVNTCFIPVGCGHYIQGWVVCMGVIRILVHVALCSRLMVEVEEVVEG